jgi:putative SOS response-associated peptidase YedK
MTKDQKKPRHEFTMPGQEPFGMAGVWKLWKNPKTAQSEKTFAVLTREVNELVQPIHGQMTTFLERRDYHECLQPAERAPIHLLRILPANKKKAELLHATPITNQQVNLCESQ